MNGWCMRAAAAGILVFALSAKAAREEVAKPKVEAMFVLDTTGSMSGLIAGAKEKIWSIANTLASADPAPEIKIGLVAYRDRGDQYVTAITPMSLDLDAVYSRLMEFQANGGGDGPESVNQALHEAITRTDWSEDKGTYKVVFLVGDCPPHMDYEDDVRYPDTCKLAAEKGIVINTVLCGANGDAMTIWKDIAVKSDGSFFQVDQGGSAVVIETPYDAKLAALAEDLDKTRIFYGTKDELAQSGRRADVAWKLGEKASVSAKAQRAAYNCSDAGEYNFAAGKELVSAYIENEAAIASVPQEQLPPELAKMDEHQLKEHVAQKSEQRRQIQAEIRELSDKRQAHIQQELAKTKGRKESSLEHKVYEAVRSQTADKSVTYNAAEATY